MAYHEYILEKTSIIVTGAGAIEYLLTHSIAVNKTQQGQLEQMFPKFLVFHV